jgi:PAS domain S-box-containing protein
VTAIRDAMREDRPISVVLTNYTKSGRQFFNLFHLAPVADDEGRTTWFVGVQTEVSAEQAAQLSFADSGEGASSRALGPGRVGARGPLSLDPGECPAMAMVRSAAPVVAAQAAALTSLLANRAAEMSSAATSSASSHGASGGVEGGTWHQGVSSAAPAAAVRPLLGAPATADTVPATLLRALVRIQQSFCLSDPNLPDCPIVHCSQAFIDMCGYPAEAILGHNCRFLQGPATDPLAVARMRDDIAAGVPTTVRLLNYTRQGRPFWNSVHVAPVRDASGKVVLLIGVQMDVTDEVQRAAEEAQMAATEVPALGVPPDVAQMGAVGAVRVAVRGLKSDALKRHGM